MKEQHPEAAQYKELAKQMKCHESSKLAKEGEQRVVLVDIDETICCYGESRKYNLAIPINKNIEKINKLYDEGWKVVYWTARGASESSIKAGRCYYELTLSQLKSWGCKFHELCTGTKGFSPKPIFDLVIDDKAKRIEEI